MEYKLNLGMFREFFTQVNNITMTESGMAVNVFLTEVLDRLQWKLDYICSRLTNKQMGKLIKLVWVNAMHLAKSNSEFFEVMKKNQYDTKSNYEKQFEVAYKALKKNSKLETILDGLENRSLNLRSLLNSMTLAVQAHMNRLGELEVEHEETIDQNNAMRKRLEEMQENLHQKRGHGTHLLGKVFEIDGPPLNAEDFPGQIKELLQDIEGIREKANTIKERVQQSNLSYAPSNASITS